MVRSYALFFYSPEAVLNTETMLGSMLVGVMELPKAEALAKEPAASLCGRPSRRWNYDWSHVNCFMVKGGAFPGDDIMK